MKKVPSIALVCAGPVSRTPLSRLPRLREQLAFVKSGSFGLASRTVNTLGGGVPVRTYEDLAPASIVMIHVPEHDVEREVRELAASKIAWTGKTVALYESAFDVRVLASLKAKGAWVSTLNTIGAYAREQFLIEGNAEGMRTLRSAVLDRGTKFVEIADGRKRAYMEASYLAGTVFQSLVAEVAESLQHAGITRNERERMMEYMLTVAMKSYFRAGRRAVRIDIDWRAWLEGKP